jgi:two-component system alkaline phosphatase synthesis response regulator PhoP
MIYCIEDDQSIRELLAYALQKEGYETRLFEDGSTLLEVISEKTPELIILDIMLPGESGLALLKKIKADNDTKDIPVILLTALGGEYDKVIGLDLGADDYISKPFSVMELLARIRAVKRRSNSTIIQHLEYNGIEINYLNRTALVDGVELDLTFKEFELLFQLFSHPGMAYSREKLLESVWGYDFEGGTRTVDVHVASLRKKLGEKGALIKTVRNIGYKAGAEA